MFDFIVSVVDSTGYAGVAFLMFLENLFPPIPSELIMPLAGYTAAQGERSLLGMILAGSAGALAGTTLWYWGGRAIGRSGVEAIARKRGRWLTIKVEDLDTAEKRFEKYGSVAVLVGRLLPTIRTLISVPAGVTRMSLPRFLLLSAIGTGAWTALLTIAGHELGRRYKTVSEWMNPVSTGIVVILVLWYLYRVANYDRASADR